MRFRKRYESVTNCPNIDGIPGYSGEEDMVKVIKIQNENYRMLLKILHELEKNKNERLSFDDVISLLVTEHQRDKKRFN